MTLDERRQAFEAASILAAGERNRIQADTVAEVTRLLRQAESEIVARLEAQPSEYEQWALPQLQKEIERVLREFAEDAGTAAMAGQGTAYDAGQALIDAPLAAAGIQVSGMAPRIDRRQLLAMQSFLTDKMRGLGLDALNRVNSELALTVIGAQGVSETIGRLQEIMGGISRRRAMTIVRTELGRAFATASQARAEEAARSVPGLKKQWRRSGKIHSRRKHDFTDGQVRPVDKPFILGTGRVVEGQESGGIRIMHPHDPAAPPAETINCGCISLPYMDSWADAGLLENPGKQPFSEQEIALNPLKQELAEPGPTMGEILDKRATANLAPPAFIGKARTVAGAERSAKKLGLKSADYSASLDIGNEVNKALELLRRRGLAIPDHVRVDASVFAHWRSVIGSSAGSAPAAFTFNRTTHETYLFFDPSDPYWSQPQTIADQQHLSGYWSTNHRLHGVIHEAGHLGHFRSAPTLYSALGGQTLSPTETLVAAKISGYALESPREFVAEVFARLDVGGTVDADVMAQYVKFGGKIP